MMSPTLEVTTPSDREIVMRRTFDAPRELVFECMSTAEHIRNWWGWSDWTMPVCEFDRRVGGRYRFVGLSPDGAQQVPFTGEILELDPPRRIVHTSVYDVPPFNQGEPAVITTDFEESPDGRTTVTLTCDYGSKEVRDIVLSTGMEKGAAHSYDRLAELLETLRQ